MRCRLLLADDHDIVRRNLREIIESRTDCIIVGEAIDGMQAVQLVRELAPDLAVVDQGDGTTAGAVSVLIGNKVNNVQDGTFGTKIDYPVGISPSAITLVTGTGPWK